MYDELTVNVHKIKDMFNNFVDMVSYEILSSEDINAAVKLIKKLLDIADWCKNEVGNYETPFYINTILLSEPISVLRSAVSRVEQSKQHKEIWDNLKITYNPDKRYQKVCVQMEHDPNTVIPCFFALRNVIYYNSDQPTMEGNLINLGKMNTNFRIINQLNIYKKRNLPFEKSYGLYEYLKAKNVTLHEEEALIEMAKQLEESG
jgi:hypothetical protein